ncbi:MAG: fibronectin type III domain-containing protein [Acidimicrobiia bacterium]|nr:fibronectin type III domain-containing protein [Acidimicrobiia bacterium]MXZ87164.1 fibronectin type III domain-containing protein [Acidimicrobiia bacterium]MYE72529.1 fibronectin type III domain-containing protein [Acidimicrobiia bacterium]
MSNGTSKPRRAFQLGGALIAIVALVVSITAIASAQTAQSRYYSGVITGPDFCINNSLGGPRTYPFDQDRDGIADVCSLPTTRRETVARQSAMELLALDFPARFGQLFAYECADVAETYGEPEKEGQDECAEPRRADAAGQAIPPVPLSRVSPVLVTTWPSGFFSGPVVTGPNFCINRSLGGPVTYPLDTNGDNVADICSLPTTRRATIARQNALEQLSRERDNLFDSLFASECARLLSTTFGEAAEARDECADPSGTGRPLPGDEDDTDTGDTGDTGDAGDTGDDDDDTGGPSRPTRPTQSVTSPTATNPGTYSKRAAQDLLLAPSDRSIVASWDPVTPDDDPEDADSDPYDANDVFEYRVQYSTSRSMSSSKELVLRLNTDGSVASTQPDNCGTESADHSEFQCPIPQLRTDTTYYVRVLANRGLGNSTGSGNSATRDYWTPTLAIRTGIAGPPRWADGDTGTDGDQPLVSEAYGEMIANWLAPAEGAPNSYTIQWGTSRSFANNCDTSNNCEQASVAPGATVAGRTTTPETGVTAYKIPGLTNNRTYYVRVQGTTANGPGTWSLTESLRLTSDLKDPGAPTNVRLTTTGTGTSLQVDWNAPPVNDNDPAATGYRVQWRNVSDNENWSASRRQSPAIAADTLTYTITGLAGLDVYEVRVLAINDRVGGPWSSTARITLGVAGAPFGITVVPGSDTIAVNWTNPSSSPSVDDIIIQWDTSRSFTNNCASDASCNEDTLASSATTFTTPRLSPNVVYYIRMRSINDNGPGPWSEIVSSEPGTLIAPTGVTAAEDNQGTQDDPSNIRNLDLSWTYTEEAGKPTLSGFALRWRRVGTTNWGSTRNISLAQAGCPTAETDYPYCSGGYSYELTGLTTGVYYEVQVLARNSYGNGPWSVTPVADPVTAADNIQRPGSSFIPSIGSITSGTDSSSRATIQVTWSAPSGSLTVSSYHVQWRSCGTSGYSCGGWGSSQTVATTDTLESLYPATSLRDGIYYQARVRANGASSSGGNSAYDESDRYPVTIDDNDTPNNRTDDTVTVGTAITNP